MTSSGCATRPLRRSSPARTSLSLPRSRAFTAWATLRSTKATCST
jgi:hypothetical protein